MIPPIYILAVDNVSASSIAGPTDIFHTTNLLIQNIVGKDAEQLKWEIVGLSNGHVTSASGMQIKIDCLLNKIKAPGWIFLSGIVAENELTMQSYLEKNQALTTQLNKPFDAGFSIAASCTGTFLLAETGLLNGLSATTTWWRETLFQKRYPRIDLDINSLVIEHERIICAGTATAHMELALYLVKKLVGHKYAHLCRKYLLLENSHKTQAPFKRLTSTQASPFIQKLNRYLLGHLHNDIRIQDVADSLSVSSRTLTRRVKKSTGDSPIQHIQKLRIERSKYLLETSNLTTDEITERIGYKDLSTFGKIFKRFTELTPAQYRQKFNIKHQ